MKTNKKIMWQKYEDVLQEQMNSPLMDSMMGKIMADMGMQPEVGEEVYAEDAQAIPTAPFMVPVDEKMLENISLTTNFDCWMGHTNFNITTEVLDELNGVQGVEVLKVCSRYRFFIGVGRMFEFSDVRQHIEKKVI